MEKGGACAGAALFSFSVARTYRGAGDGTRTHDVQLGKLAFYQLNYARVVRPKDTARQNAKQVARERLNLRGMTDLPTTSSQKTAQESRRFAAITGAAFGALLWLECIALGLPNILYGSAGYELLPMAALAGAIVGLTPMHRLLAIPVVALALVLVVIAYTPIMRGPVRALTRSDSIGARPIHAVVVLSGGVTHDGHLKSQATDRLLTGLALIRRGVANTLIVSRERDGAGEVAVTSDADQQRLAALLERPVRLLIVDSVFSTRDEAVRMRALGRPLDITSVAVVTSPIHTFRACAVFEKVSFTVTCVPSESRKLALGALRGPSDRVLAFQLWLYEMVALAKYRVSGWM
jgi:uncharacterized SAM-binding protein YcdF (DUF218 family)